MIFFNFTTDDIPRVYLLSIVAAHNVDKPWAHACDGSRSGVVLFE